MTSASSLGSTQVTLQFDLSRDIDGAARDVEAAINASRSYLPSNLPGNPTYRKVNPADSPIMILGLTSDKYAPAQMYDAASTVIEQKLSQISGVGQINLGGGALPAVRVEANPAQLAHYGLSTANLQTVLSAQNANMPKGQIINGDTSADILANDQITRADQYQNLEVGYSNGAAVRLSDVAEVTDSVQKHPRGRVSERQTRGDADHFPPARRQYHPDRRQYPRTTAHHQGLDPQRHRYHGGAGSHHYHSGLGERRRENPDHLHLPGGDRRLHFLTQYALDVHSGHCDAGCR